ncbi:triosephosphate isomerase [Fonticula alba]|uniref:Triosephosphate isomerase n=1 Tax=Fonticula alba TaxID=691883 RepID=A0A058YZ51_FONAL|nr:triosephosphate isomerase [Fonticula alba]KCV67280.1 triosephosphate isomerase [Fonticula alba]|eukprot:XP_009498316.1 triosephosphate isomerase [Fonticula alba]
MLDAAQSEVQNNFAQIGKILGKIDTNVVDVTLAPTFVHIPLASTLVGSIPGMSLASQNCAPSDAGAFTGEVSPSQLKEFGVQWVIIGHSERRTLFAEPTELLKQKVNAALKAGLGVILCIGEAQVEEGRPASESVVMQQVRDIFLAASDAPAFDPSRIVIAYEPVWAIGTGLTATPDYVLTMHTEIRRVLAELPGPAAGAAGAAAARIIYGGSVTKANSFDLAKMSEVNGFLLGRASTQAEEFAAIINLASQAKAEGK